MPLFEFHCKSCLKDFEELVFSDEAPACPHCHSQNTEKLISRPCRSHGGGLDIGSMPSSGSSSGGCSGCSGGSCASCGH